MSNEREQPVVESERVALAEWPCPFTARTSLGFGILGPVAPVPRGDYYIDMGDRTIGPLTEDELRAAWGATVSQASRR